MTGCIMLCESLRSEQAAPIAMKTDPNISTAQSRYTTNQASSAGCTSSNWPACISAYTPPPR